MSRLRSWIVPATVMRHIDGDTVVMDLDLGWRVWLRDVSVRLASINCPELNTPAGKAAAARTRELCPVGCAVVVLSHSLDKYGRVLANVLLPDQRDLAGVLLAEGHAAPAGRRGGSGRAELAGQHPPRQVAAELEGVAPAGARPRPGPVPGAG